MPGPEPLTLTSTECRFCHSAATVQRTADGWQCIDIIDCYGRQSTEED